MILWEFYKYTNILSKGQKERRRRRKIVTTHRKSVYWIEKSLHIEVFLLCGLFGFGREYYFDEFLKCTNWANKNMFNESWPGTFIKSILCVKLFIKPSSVKSVKRSSFIFCEKREIEITLELNSAIFYGCKRYVPSKFAQKLN